MSCPVTQKFNGSTDNFIISESAGLCEQDVRFSAMTDQRCHANSRLSNNVMHSSVRNISTEASTLGSKPVMLKGEVLTHTRDSALCPQMLGSYNPSGPMLVDDVLLEYARDTAWEGMRGSSPAGISSVLSG